MKIRLNLKNKMQLYLISLSVAIYATAIGYISINAKRAAYNDSVEIVNTYAEKYAFQIQSDLNEYFSTVRTLSKAFSINLTVLGQNLQEELQMFIPELMELFILNRILEALMEILQFIAT